MGKPERDRGRFSGLWISPWTITTLFAIIIFLLSLQVWGLRLFGSGIDYNRAGNWGEMTSGVAGGLAVTVAVATVTSERRRLANERREARIASLTRVYCWLQARERTDGEQVWFLHFENGTYLPVYPWTARLHTPGTEPLVLHSSKYGPIRPSTSEMRLSSDSLARFNGEPEVTLQFTDADRRQWKLDREGLHPDTSV